MQKHQRLLWWWQCGGGGGSNEEGKEETDALPFHPQGHHYDNNHQKRSVKSAHTQAGVKKEQENGK